MQVIKRSGKHQDFELKKINRAMLLAFDAVQPANIPNVTALMHQVAALVSDTLSDGPLTVDFIQDSIEKVLLRSGHFEVARHFIKYRLERDAARQERLNPDGSAICEYINVSKYAKYLPEKSRRETHFETVSRSKDMHVSRFPHLAQEIYNAFDKVYQREVLPSMRGMQFAGKAAELINARMYNCSFTLIDRTRAFQEAFYLLLCGCGVGYSVQQQHIAKLPPVMEFDPKRVAHHVVEDSIYGWAEALGHLVSTAFYTGEWPEFAYHLIRKENSPLKTSGGKAPGHLPLKRALDIIFELLRSAQGRQLRSLEVHDIMCHLAEAVLAGGIRRSSLICLFTNTDTEMLFCKAKGNYRQAFGSDPGYNAHREMANNSGVLLRATATRADFELLVNIAQSNFGCPGFFFTDNLDHGTNPCFAGDTIIHTDEGLRRIEDLEGKQVRVIQADGSVEQASAVQRTGKNRQVFLVKFKSGRELKVTDNHEFPTFRGRLQLKDMLSGDKVHTQNSEGKWGTTGTYEEGLTYGLWLGDGTSTQDEAHICLWGEDQRWKDYIREIVNSALNTDYDWYWSGDHLRLGSNKLKHFVGASKSLIPESILFGSRDVVRGFLEGMFFCDGCITGSREKGYSLRLSQSNKELLQQTQILLSNFGIQSRIRLLKPAGYKKMPGGRYSCKDSWELILSRQNMDKFVKTVGLFGPTYEKYLTIKSKSYCKADSYDVMESVSLHSTRDVFCLNVYKTHNLVASGILTGNCGEIGLNPVYRFENGSTATGFSFCNLTEVNGATAKTGEDLWERVEAATIIGTLQASMNKFPYLGIVTEAIARRDNLLGVSITGIMDNPEICLEPAYTRPAAQLAVATNKEWAAKLGIKPAKRVTTVKPSGTGSLALGAVGSGIHPSHARRYFRRVTANPNEPPAQYFRSINPHMVEEKPNGDLSVIFPIVVPETSLVLEDISAIEFCEHVSNIYENWVKPGTAEDDEGLTHNVSCTVTLRKGEMEEVLAWIWKNRERVKAMSFVPDVLDKLFSFAPRRKCYPEDEAKWNKLIENYKHVDWSAMVEVEDTTTRQISQACAGNKCDV